MTFFDSDAFSKASKRFIKFAIVLPKASSYERSNSSSVIFQRQFLQSPACNKCWKVHLSYLTNFSKHSSLVPRQTKCTAPNFFWFVWLKICGYSYERTINIQTLIWSFLIFLFKWRKLEFPITFVSRFILNCDLRLRFRHIQFYVIKHFLIYCDFANQINVNFFRELCPALF